MCSADVCGIGDSRVGIINSVVDLVGNDDSIRLLRWTPSDHYGSEPWLSNKVGHHTGD